MAEVIVEPAKVGDGFVHREEGVSTDGFVKRTQMADFYLTPAHQRHRITAHLGGKMNPRRHKNDTKTFEELTFKDQARAMNMTALQFRKQLEAHLRRANEEGRSGDDVLKTRLGLLQGILSSYQE